MYHDSNDVDTLCDGQPATSRDTEFLKSNMAAFTARFERCRGVQQASCRAVHPGFNATLYRQEQ